MFIIIHYPQCNLSIQSSVIVFVAQDISSHKRSRQDSEPSPATRDEPINKKACLEAEEHNTDSTGPSGEVERQHREPRACTIRIDDGAILRQCLDYLQKILQKFV